MTEALFRKDGYVQQCEAVVVRVDPAGVVLDRTVFYPDGGGQPGDSGVLSWSGGQVRVVDTRKSGEADDIIHVLGGDQALPAVGTAVVAKIDWDRRYRHMRMHTALHLMTSLVDAPITGARLSAEKGYVDFDLPDSLDKAALEDAFQGLIAADSPVAAEWIDEASLAGRTDLVRTLNVAPPALDGQVRIVQIAGVDAQACGGTHVRSTAEVGQVRLGKIDKKGRLNRRFNILFLD